MTNEAADILRKAKELIETKGWTQGAAARDMGALAVEPEDPSAVCFCLYGAVSAGAAEIGSDNYSAWELVKRAGPNTSPISWQDNAKRTRQEVICRLDRAIALAEADHA